MGYVIGIDEAGRGPLAGPVAVGAVCTPHNLNLFGLFPTLNDSKKLSEKKREAIFAELENHPDISWCVEWGSVEEIDDEGITRSVAKAIERAVRALLPDPSRGTIFLDGLLKAPKEYEQETIVKGDATVPAIMLASIIAKVSRDRLITELSDRHPEYDFARHKGYGTAIHMEKITLYGLSPLHRKTFCKTF
jgi:ribonuclease HII